MKYIDARTHLGGKRNPGTVGGWAPDHYTIQKMIENIPNDGCILVFNGNHSAWRKRAHETGVLRCRVVQSGKSNPSVSRAKVRDLYITWRD